jgi:hypothetical protein
MFRSTQKVESTERMDSGSELCGVFGLYDLEDMRVAIAKIRVEFGNCGRRDAADGHYTVLVLMLLLDFDVFSEDYGVWVAVTVEHKFQTAGGGECCWEQRDIYLNSEAVDLKVECLTSTSLVVDLCRYSARSGS